MTVSNWLFGPADRAIRVRNAEALLAQLPFFLAWPFQWAGPPGTSPPQIEITEPAAGLYRIDGPGPAAGPFDDAIDAAAAFAGSLIAAYVADDPALACYDAAAVATPAGLALIAGRRPGDTVILALALAARGYRLFGTDRIAVRAAAAGAPTGICLGTMPIMSGPMPADAEPVLVQFIDGYAEMRRGDSVFLKLWAEEAAAFGETAPVAVWIEVEERAGAEIAVAAADAPLAGVAGHRIACDGLSAALRLVTGILGRP